MSFQEAVILANREIAALLQTADDSFFTAGGTIGFGGDHSLKVDLVAEEIFIKHLLPFGRINSEECGHLGDGEDEIVIDPIDGSSNLASGLPYFGTSVALKRHGNAIVSIVCNLASGDYFIRDIDGMFRRRLLDDRAVPLSKEICPLVGIFEKAYSHPHIAEMLRKHSIKFRSPGALAISLAYAHSVRFVMSAGGHREYDIIAGLHISSDLYRYIGERMIIISREKEIFDLLVKLFGKGAK
ncbi:MAG: inositol monophosphatase [Helicobacteraceae bacterium]|jgi:myo-inositol-1(or 4)-monophosphatase|nr:inositol monophosphatase [Helicobacteraceae bacterium]